MLIPSLLFCLMTVAGGRVVGEITLAPHVEHSSDDELKDFDLTTTPCTYNFCVEFVSVTLCLTHITAIVLCMLFQLRKDMMEERIVTDGFGSVLRKKAYVPAAHSTSGPSTPTPSRDSGSPPSTYLFHNAACT